MLPKSVQSFRDRFVKAGFLGLKLAGDCKMVVKKPSRNPVDTNMPAWANRKTSKMYENGNANAHSELL